MYLIIVKLVSAKTALTILIYGFEDSLSSRFFAIAKLLKLYVLFNNNGVF
jgi:hypothetical protein